MVNGINILNDLKSRKSTRFLYEEVFDEDSKSFVDYYYQHKIQKNIIYGLYEMDQLVSMIHLNPYTLQLDSTLMDTHYIVAVATLKNHRGKGLMKALLIRCLEDMANNGEAFTWLMPAHEDIYLPYGFRHIYQQSVYHFKAEEVESHFHFEKCTHLDEEKTYQNDYLQNYDLFPIRDISYMKILEAELQSEKGHIIQVYDQSKKIGSFSYALGVDSVEIRNLFLESSYVDVVSKLLSQFVKDFNIQLNKINVMGSIIGKESHEYTTGMMARILNISQLAKRVYGHESDEIILSILDPIIKSQEGTYRWQISPEGSELTKISDRVESNNILLIEDMTDLMFRGKIQDKEAKKRIYYEGYPFKDQYHRVIGENLEEFLKRIEIKNQYYFTELV